MRKVFLFLIGLTVVVNYSCTKDNGLSDDEIIQGLKAALKVGTDTSSTNLHKKNGYYGDVLVKILLPPDAHGVLEHKDDPMLQAVGIDQKIDSLILSLNRSAEDAAIEAEPIFANAITSMTISDGVSILHGTDSAATVYLKTTTRAQLFNVFLPKFQVSLNKPLVAGMSAVEAWNQLKSVYNPLCNPLTGWQPITSNLDTFATNKGLDGLFMKISVEEKNIRHNSAYRINDILRKVFGSLD
jgi:hypothetical protein